MTCTLFKIFFWCSNATQHSGKFKHVREGVGYVKTQLSCFLFIMLTTTCFGHCEHVVSVINRIQDSCVVTYPTHSPIAYNTTGMMHLKIIKHVHDKLKQETRLT